MPVIRDQQHERTIRWAKNEIQSIKNRMGGGSWSGGGSGGVSGEPALGNPAADGYALVSTAAGVRSWSNLAVLYAALAHTHAYEPAIAAGSAGQYWKHDKTFAALNQAAVDGLKTTQSPAFKTVVLSDLTDGYIAYAKATAAGLANSGLFWDATNLRLGVGLASPQKKVHILGTDGAVANFPTLGGRDQLVVENNHNCNISIISSGADDSRGGLRFFKSGGTDSEGEVRYYHGAAGSYNYLAFITVKTEQVFIDREGKMGVGYMPSYKFDVNGNIRCATGFGCNSKAPQTAAASGGALAAYGAGAYGLDSAANMQAMHALVVAIRAALVADGIMS